MNNSLNLLDCVSEVCNATGLSPPIAEALLQRNNWQTNPEKAIDNSIQDANKLDANKKQQLKRIACDAGQAGIGNFLGSLLDNYLRDRSVRNQNNQPYDRYPNQPYDRYNNQPYDRYNNQPYDSSSNQHYYRNNTQPRRQYQPESRPVPQFRSYEGPQPESDWEERYRELEEKYQQLEERLNRTP